MSLSMYQASIPAFVQMLNNLSAILDKAEAHARNRKIDPEVLLNYRLAPDMLPFVRQIQIASDQAKGAAARLAGVEVPKHDDTEKTFAGSLRVSRSCSPLNPVTLKAWRTHDEFQGPALSSAFCDAPFLFPLHHRLRHSAALRC
jgi:hypothetical protein